LRLRILDAAVIALVLSGTGLLAWRVYLGDSTPPVLHITAAAGEWYYPLDRDREITVCGPLGDTMIVIEHGAAHVAASACPEKICVRSAGIRRNGEWIACLPNRVLLTIEGSGEGRYDAESF
jgi:hypothetical protein